MLNYAVACKQLTIRYSLAVKQTRPARLQKQPKLLLYLLTLLYKDPSINTCLSLEFF
jgi:hypothetical protein